MKLDLAVILRRVVDGAAEDLFAGNQIDSGKLVTAVERLIDMLPARKLPQPQRPDPRELMLAELRQMAARGELVDAETAVTENEHLRERVRELEYDLARLRGAGIPRAAMPDTVEALQAALTDIEHRLAVLRGEDDEEAITPSLGDITPPSERTDLAQNMQQRPGPDDHRVREPVIKRAGRACRKSAEALRRQDDQTQPR